MARADMTGGAGAVVVLVVVLGGLVLVGALGTTVALLRRLGDHGALTRDEMLEITGVVLLARDALGLVAAAIAVWLVWFWPGWVGCVVGAPAGIVCIAARRRLMTGLRRRIQSSRDGGGESESRW